MRRVMNRNLKTRLVSICALASMTFLAACSSSDDRGVAGGASGERLLRLPHLPGLRPGHRQRQRHGGRVHRQNARQDAGPGGGSRP